jgi:arginase
MDVQIIAVPYDSGYKAIRMGRGPGHLLLNGVSTRLREAGHLVSVEVVEDRQRFQAEITTSFELYRLLAAQVGSASERGVFPLVLSGNCGSALGSIGGLGADSLGLIWFDAHGDFNTPETTTSGFLDGMALAAMTGRCWKALTGRIPGFSPLPEDRVLHLGARDLDPLEKGLLDESGVTVLSANRLNSEGVEAVLSPALDRLRTRVKRVYIHIDLDVIDPHEAPANEFAPPGGLNVNQVIKAIQAIRDRFPITSAGLASYDPEQDRDGRALRAGFRLIEALVANDS